MQRYQPQTKIFGPQKKLESPTAPKIFEISTLEEKSLPRSSGNTLKRIYEYQYLIQVHIKNKIITYKK